jgi:hypothetical protein
MDQIINYLLLVIIFVFDPLAISLVIAANFAFEKAFPKKQYKENLYGETEEIVEEPIVESESEIEGSFNSLDINKDGIVDEVEVKTAESRLSELKHLLNTSISSWRRNKIINEINSINSSLNDNETKTY